MDPYDELGPESALDTEVPEDWTWVDPAECERSKGTGHPCSKPLGASEADATSACQSPTSEMAADMVLGQPLLPQPEEARAEPPPRLSSADADAAAAAGVMTAAVQQQESRKQSLVHQPDQLQGPKAGRLAAVTSAVTAAVSAWTNASMEIIHCAVEDTKREWQELLLLLGQALVRVHAGMDYLQGAACTWMLGMKETALMRADHAKGAAHACMQGVKRAMDQQGLNTKVLRHRVAEAWHSRSPSWALLSMGAVTALSTVAIGSLLCANHSLSSQLKQRDRELAQLVMRIMNLQESLHSSRAALPVVRHLMQPGFMVSSLA